MQILLLYAAVRCRAAAGHKAVVGEVTVTGVVCHPVPAPRRYTAVAMTPAGTRTRTGQPLPTEQLDAEKSCGGG